MGQVDSTSHNNIKNTVFEKKINISLMMNMAHSRLIKKKAKYFKKWLNIFV